MFYVCNNFCPIFSICYLVIKVDKSDDEKKLVTSFSSKPNTSASFIPLMPGSGIDEETAESILDQHCSRIWASSNHHTPSYSPGHQSPPHSKSPDRHKDIRSNSKKAANLSSTSGSGGAVMSAPGAIGAYSFRAHQKKRGASGSDLTSASMDDRSLLLCNTETHRHIHHHHHHHHSSRDSSLKKTVVEIEAQNCSMNAFRGTDTNFTDFVSPAGHDHTGSRGRTAATKRCSGSSSVRKNASTLDSSSNFDSGISGLDKDSRVPPIWNSATDEKYVLNLLFTLYLSL